MEQELLMNKKDTIKKRIYTIKKRQIPEGYKACCSHIYPMEWQMVKIKDLTIVKSGSTPLRAKYDRYFKNGQIKWVKTLDLNNGLLKDTQEKITDLAIKESSCSIFPRNTILVAMYGGFNQIGRTGLMDFEGAINQALSAIIPNFRYNSRFLLYWLNFKVLEWRNFAASSRKDPNITKNDVENFIVILPSIKEQEKIADILSCCDEIVELKQNLIDYKKLERKLLLNEFFSKINNNKNNKYIKLGKVCEMFSGGTPNIEISDYYGGDIPFIKSGEIDCLKTEDYLTELGFKHSSAKLVNVGDFLLALYGANSGNVAISKVSGAINQAILCVRSSIILPYYLLLLFQLNKEKIVKKYLQGGQGNLSAQIIKSLSFYIPSFEVQKRIIQYFSEFDKEINLLQQELEEYKKLKKSLSQLLLTGIVRTV